MLQGMASIFLEAHFRTEKNFCWLSLPLYGASMLFVYLSTSTQLQLGQLKPILQVYFDSDCPSRSRFSLVFCFLIYLRLFVASLDPAFITDLAHSLSASIASSQQEFYIYAMQFYRLFTHTYNKSKTTIRDTVDNLFPCIKSQPSPQIKEIVQVS